MQVKEVWMTEAKDYSSSVVNVKPDEAVMSLQRLPYFWGISGRSTGAQRLSMHLVVLPPGAVSEAHSHCGFETGIYVLEGRVKTFYGQHLEHEIVSEPGDFLYIAADCPHKAINLDEHNPARAIVSRTNNSETEDTIPYEVPEV